MPTTVSVTKITKEPLPSTRCLIRFSDGAELEYPSFAALKEGVAEIDRDVQLTRQLALGWWLARSADGSNVNLIEGKQVTFDLSSPNAIRVQ